LKRGNDWFNAPGGGDFTVPLGGAEAGGSEAGAGRVVCRACEAETWGNFSQFNRLCLCLELLPAPDAADGAACGALFTWLRYAHLKLLPNYKNSNYQSKDAAHVQEQAAQRFTDVACKGVDADARMFARMALGTLPRGGGNGDDIRMGILHIMRGNGIREGHRPGIEDRFLEEWHQKLHTNTGPDDIGICESYLHYLHTGSLDEFYRYAWDVHRISRAYLESMDHPIRGPPLHMPHLIPAFQGYLHTLKVTHGGANLDTAFQFAQGALDDGLRWTIGDLLSNRDAWWAPGKIVEIRSQLQPHWRRPQGAGRDIVMLDIALENHFRTLVERTDKAALSQDDLIALITLSVRNAAVSGDYPELDAAAALWRALESKPDKWSPAWSSAAAAAADFTSQGLQAVSNRINAYVTSAAESIGHAGKVDQAYITNFAEEVVRGASFAVLAPLLRAADTHLRNTAGLGSWSVASVPPNSGTVSGAVLCCPLSELQGHAVPQPTVVLSPRLNGLEDIPEGIVAVITGSAVDVLSHVALRARAQGVLLASCLDGAEFDALQARFTGSASDVHLSVSPSGDVLFHAHDGVLAAKDNGSITATAATAATPKPKMKAKRKAADGLGLANSGDEWALGEIEFKPGRVGGKALGCAGLRAALSAADLIVPPSVALPYGTFERVLAHADNIEVAGKLAALQAKADAAHSGLPSEILAELRSIVATQLLAPPELVAALEAKASAAGMCTPGAWTSSEAAFEPLWDAVSAVWASKWADRAWLSRRTAQVSDEALAMGVLIQPVAAARYAFVLHTTHPLTHDAGTMLGEIVCGLGEALVGAYPGRALSFSCDEKSRKLHVHALPSKLQAFWARAGAGVNLIARSDSNGEDLEGFAGAGLYDSIPVDPQPLREVVRYDSEPLLWDENARSKLLMSIAKAGWAARDALQGGALDCEGVVLEDGRIVLVQARPQVI